MNRLSEEHVIDILKEKGLYICRGQKYTNNSTKIECVDELGYLYFSIFANYKNSKNQNKFNLNDFCIYNIKNFIRLNFNDKFELISDACNGTKDNITLKCKKDGKIWSPTLDSLLMLKGCPRCAKRERITISEAKTITSKINKDIMLLSEEYKDMHTKMLFHCNIHNHTWKYTLDEFKDVKRCPKCTTDAISRENNYNWKGGNNSTSNYLRQKLSDWNNDSMVFCNFKCIITKQRFDTVHHLYSYNKIIKELSDVLHVDLYDDYSKFTKEELNVIIDNCLKLHYKYGLGVCLSKTIHEDFHKKYGKIDNTKEQFLEYVYLYHNDAYSEIFEKLSRQLFTNHLLSDIL